MFACAATLIVSARTDPSHSFSLPPPPLRCLFQVSYAIGVTEPLSIYVDTYGTGAKDDAEILAIVKKNFDFRPGMIGKNLDLKRGGNKRYQKTAAYGHFGRDDPDFTWETVKPLA